MGGAHALLALRILSHHNFFLPGDVARSLRFKRGEQVALIA